jgi:hypothetical protein
MIKRSRYLPAALATLIVLTCGWEPKPVWAQRVEATQANSTNQVVGIGRLIRSGKARNGTPRFALLDGQGTLTAYVVPAAGVILAEHLNQDVAITARNVSRDPDGLPYLMAQHVGRVPGTDMGVSPEQSRRVANEQDLAADEPRIVDETLDQLGALDSAEQDGAITPEEFADDFGSGLDRAWGAGVADEHAVRPAANYEPVAEEEIVEPTEVLPEAAESVLADEYTHQPIGCGNPSCSTCAPCGPCTDRCCPCGPAGRTWFRVDYLGWETKVAHTPPLVTTSPAGTPAQDAGVLGVAGTEILSGGSDAHSLARSGVRFVLGGWLDPCQRNGVEVDYFFLDDERETASFTSFGDPILARPFFNTKLDLQDSELVAFPGIVSGTVAVDYETKLQSIAPRWRHNLRCDNFYGVPCGGCDDFGRVGCGPSGGTRVDWTVGYRYMKLEEGLRITEDLVSQADSTFATFNLADVFETSNEFNGLELGLNWDTYRGRWSMEVATRFAAGNNQRKVAINGRTTSVIQGAVFDDPGALLALPSNIGTYKDDEFVVIPELTVSLGYQIAPRVRFLVGYTIIYWNNVVRPGDQIDLNVNTDQLPPALDTDGLLAPAFAMNDTTFWAHGINLGMDWRW